MKRLNALFANADAQASRLRFLSWYEDELRTERPRNAAEVVSMIERMKSRVHEQPES